MSNNKLLRRDKLFVLSAAVFIIYMTFPLIGYFIHIPVGVINLAVSLAVIVLYPQAFNNKTCFWFFLYSGVLLLYLITGKDLPPLGIGDYEDRRIFVIEMAFILPSLSIWSVLKYRNNQVIYNLISKVAIISLTLSFLYLVPLVLTNDNLLRSTVEGYYEYQIPGIPYYTLVHAYILLFPCILFQFVKERGNRKIISFFILILYSLVIIKSNVTTLLVLWVLSILLTIVFNSNNKAKSVLIIIGIGLLFALLYATGMIDMILSELSDSYKGTSAYGKIEELRLSLNGTQEKSYILEERKGLHSKSIIAFKTNFITGDASVGGHSQILDRLGGLGLLGFIPYLGILVSFIKKEKSELRSALQGRLYFAFFVVIALTLLYQKGLFGQEGWLFLMVLAPAYIRYVENTGKNEIV